MADTSDACGPLNVAVFVSRSGVVLVRLEDDTDGVQAAAVAGRGYDYAGCIGVNEGIPTVHCDPEFEGVMPYAGMLFADLLGPHLKDHQLKMRRVREME